MKDIEIVYEDEYLAVINKPAGLSVHPGAGEEQYTLVDFLISHYPNFLDKFTFKDRAGIVHRLDKDTSGLIIIAKDEETKQLLQDQFRRHEVKKEYLTLVIGEVTPKEGIIHTLISRDPRNRTKMAVSLVQFPWDKGVKRDAITHYTTKQVYDYHSEKTGENTKFTLINVDLKTGRMHQIRVHFQYISHPVVGDPIYNNKKSKQISQELDLSRQFLHAYRLRFTHPYTHQKLDFEANLSNDLAQVLDTLATNSHLT